MKRPVNFDKIQFKRFDINGNQYKISFAGMGDVVWAFRQPDDTDYCLAICFDWENGQFSVKKAENGRGDNWISILHKGPISKSSLKSPITFTQWMSNVISNFEFEYQKR